MPVFLLTAHAYLSWSEAHPRGYIQHGNGLQPSNPALAQWRRQSAKHAPVRWSRQQQQSMLAVAQRVVVQREARLHAVAACLTHVHMLVSFRTPGCTCGEREVCLAHCPALERACLITRRAKQQMGRSLSEQSGQAGSRWFSRGYDTTAVRRREHFEFLVTRYLPDHEGTQGGCFWKE